MNQKIEIRELQNQKKNELDLENQKRGVRKELEKNHNNYRREFLKLPSSHETMKVYFQYSLLLSNSNISLEK